MIKEAICEGSDVTVALEKAKAELGLADGDDYEFEIIQTEEKKKFGLFGGRPAKVRVYIEVKDPVAPVVKKPAAPAAPVVSSAPLSRRRSFPTVSLPTREQRSSSEMFSTR